MSFLSLFLFFLFGSTSAIFAATYQYDANGNMTSDGTQCFTYNDANKLSQVKNCSNNQLIAEYVYDHTGARVIKKEYENGTLKQTIYSPSDDYETKKLASNGATSNTTYYFANDEILAKKNPDGSKNYYQNDHLGSASLITNASGGIVEETQYYPFGDVRVGGVISKYQFTGQEKDQETGLNYYGARYYNSKLGRFTQPDTILPDIYDPQQLNRYAYTRNNPVKYTDPTGHNYNPVTFLAGGAAGLGYGLYQSGSNWVGLGESIVKGDFGSSMQNIEQINEKVYGNVFKGAFLGGTMPGKNPATNKSQSTGSNTNTSTSAKISESVKGTYSSKYVVDNPTKGWKVGDPINNLTSAGKTPEWATVRQRFWKNEALYSSQNYSKSQISSMQKGNAPMVINSSGKWEPMELHHTPAQRDGGLYGFNPVTPDQHKAIDPYRR